MHSSFVSFFFSGLCLSLLYSITKFLKKSNQNQTAVFVPALWQDQLIYCYKFISLIFQFIDNLQRRFNRSIYSSCIRMIAPSSICSCTVRTIFFLYSAPSSPVYRSSRILEASPHIVPDFSSRHQTAGAGTVDKHRLSHRSRLFVFRISSLAFVSFSLFSCT